MPHEATKLETTELSGLLRRLLDEVDKGIKQETSVDVRCSSDNNNNNNNNNVTYIAHICQSRK